MMARTQITLDPEAHRAARRRAAAQGISLAEYIRRLVHEDLAEEKRPAADVSALFDIGDSGGSDVAKHKHDYVGDAVDSLHPRR